MSLEQDFSVTEISPDIHLCPGIGTLEYVYDQKSKELVINHEGNELKVLHGAAALSVFKKVSENDVDYTPDELDVDVRAKIAFGHNIETLRMRTRIREIVEERQIAMWYLSNNTTHSLSAIGELFGGYDHATVLHAKKQVNDLMCSDMDFRRKVELFIKAGE
jgi:hypothetical protein